MMKLKQITHAVTILCKSSSIIYVHHQEISCVWSTRNEALIKRSETGSNDGN